MGNRAEPRKVALSVGLCAAALGCGDIGDAQLPLPVYGAGARGSPDELALTPDPSAAVPAQAVASVTVRPLAGGACPMAFEALLPDTSASQSLVNGAGPRAIDGDDAQIVCYVLPAPDSPGAFQIILSLQHPQLPWLRASGRLEPPASSLLVPSGARASGGVTLWLTTPDATELSADCSVEADEVLSGAVWFHSIACQTSASEPRGGACDVAVRAIFENCRQ